MKLLITMIVFALCAATVISAPFNPAPSTTPDPGPVCVNTWKLDYCTKPAPVEGGNCDGCTTWSYLPGWGNHSIFKQIKVECIATDPTLHVQFNVCQGYDCKNNSILQCWRAPDGRDTCAAPRTTRITWNDGWQSDYGLMQAAATQVDPDVCVNRWVLNYCTKPYDSDLGMCGGTCQEWHYQPGLNYHDLILDGEETTECIYVDPALEVEFTACHQYGFHRWWETCHSSDQIDRWTDKHGNIYWNTPDTNHVEWRDGWTDRDVLHPGSNVSSLGM